MTVNLREIDEDTEVLFAVIVALPGPDDDYDEETGEVIWPHGQPTWVFMALTKELLREEIENESFNGFDDSHDHFIDDEETAKYYLEDWWANWNPKLVFLAIDNQPPILTKSSTLIDEIGYWEQE